MSFWAGLGRAMESNEAQRNVEDAKAEREAARGKDEAWKLKVFEYNRKRDVAADEYQASTLRLKEDDLLLKYLPEGVGTRSGGSKAGVKAGNGPTLKHVLAVVEKGGVSADTLTPFLANTNLGVKAIQATHDQYMSYKKAHASTPGGGMGMDEFFSKTILTTTPGEEVTEEMVNARAAQLGRDPEEVVAGMTVGERIRRNLTRPGEFNVEAPIAADPLKQDDIKAIRASADDMMEAVLEGHFNTLKALKNESDNAGKKDPELAARFVKAERALEDFGQGVNTLDIIREFGANSILSVLSNSPGAVDVYSFGHSYNRAIDSKTYASEKDAVEAFRKGDLLKDDYFVVGRSIHVVEGDKFKAAVDPISSGSDANQEYSNMLASYGLLGEAVGTLPDTFGEETAEVKPEEPKGYFDATGLGRGGVKDAIETNGLNVGDTFMYNGEPKKLTTELLTLLGIESTQEVSPNEPPVIKGGDLKGAVMPTELNPDITKALSKIPVEVKRAVRTVVEGNNPETIEGAISDITEEYGGDVAVSLFTEAGYQPSTMMATELNTPAIREALSKVPTEVQQAITSVVTKGSPEDIEQAKQDVAQEYGEAVASILFDDAKSGRGTGKSAMMDGLQ